MTRLALALALAVSSLALADVPPPDSAGCQNKTVGAACERDDKSAGSCVKSTCTRNDYSNGPPPTQVSYECLRCEAGAPTPPTDEKKSACSTTPGALLLALGALLLRRRA